MNARKSILTHQIQLRFGLVLLMLLLAVYAQQPLFAAGVQSLQAQGEIEALKGNWLLARRFFREALAQQPENTDLILLAARAEQELGNNEGAEELLRSGIDRSPVALLQLAEFKVAQHRWQAAANLLNRYEKQVQRDPRAMFMQALTAFHLGNYDESLKKALEAGNLDNTYKGLALLLAAQVKFRMADPAKATKALRMAAPVINGTSGEALAADLQDLIDSRGGQKKRWWIHAWSDTFYTTNKPFLYTATRTRFLDKDIQGDLLDNHRVVDGVVSYIRLNGAGTFLLEPFSASAGYIADQQVAGNSSGTYRTPYGTQAVVADLTSVHTFWMDASKYIPLETFSVDPGLEFNFTLDAPGFSLQRIGFALAPRNSFYLDDHRSVSILWHTAWLIDREVAIHSSVEWGPLFQFQYTGRSAWRFARVSMGFGNHLVSSSNLSYGWQKVRLDSRLNPWKGLLFDVLTEVEQRSFPNRPDRRVDSLMVADARAGWAFLDYHLIIQALAAQTWQLSTADQFDARALQYGLRIGGAF